MSFQPSYRPPLSSRYSLSSNSTYPASPPSLSYSDISSENSEVCSSRRFTSLNPPVDRGSLMPPQTARDRDRIADQAPIQDIMAFGKSPDPNHVSDVMAEALDCLRRVVDHFRVQDENEAANCIARDVHSMLDTFNRTTNTWGIEKFQIKPAPSVNPGQLTASRTTSLVPHATVHASTWAAVAATDIPANNRLVKFRPSDGLKRHVTDEVAVQPHDEDEDMRCAWVYGWNRNRHLQNVTDRIAVGAIFSVVYVHEHEAVCIIFQHASSALLLAEEEQRSQRELGVGLYGVNTEIRLGSNYPQNSDLLRMAPPVNERRRLTFARQQLFTNGMTKERFTKDIHDIVGGHNVVLVWLFNTGNATVVFTATVIARRVRDEFIQLSRERGPYQDVQVGFSHDPCERPMNLITQIPYPVSGAASRERSDSGKSASSGGRGYNPTAPKFVPGATTRPRKGTDSDGWQTVSRKR